jgi:hypothetical protein
MPSNNQDDYKPIKIEVWKMIYIYIYIERERERERVGIIELKKRVLQTLFL